MEPGTAHNAKVTLNARQAMRWLYEQGKTLKEIADDYNVNPSTVRDQILRAGGEMRPRGHIPGKPRKSPRRKTDS